MLYVTSLDRTRSEALNNISDDFRMEQQVDGTFTVSFTTFPQNNPGYEILSGRSTVFAFGYEFTVEQMNNNGLSKSVTCISTFFLNAKRRKYDTFQGTPTLANHLQFALSGTGWSFTIESGLGANIAEIPELGNDNVIAIIEKIKQAHRCEYQILVDNQVHFATKIGPQTEFTYRYKHNVNSVVQTENYAQLYTFIRGYGADGVIAEYTSPNASTFGILEQEPFRDDRYTDSSSLRDRLTRELKDEVELSIETSTVELTNKDIGQRVWLIYEPLGIQMETRILKQTKIIRNGSLITATATFGNTVIKDTLDTLVEQQQTIKEQEVEIIENRQEYRSGIEQNDNRITLEVEQIDRTIASIQIEANRINLSVSNLETFTQSSINILENQISLKVDQGGTIADINLSPGVATINANKINLNGAVLANGTITGTSSINIATDAFIGNNLYLANGINSTKSIIFGGVSRINGNFGNINISAPTVTIDSRLQFLPGTVVDFTGATVIGLP